MYAGRGPQVPWYRYKGGRRVLALLPERHVYMPGYKVRRIRDSSGIVVREEYDKLPFNRGLCVVKPLTYTRRLPHQEAPPSGTKTVFLKRRVGVPPGQINGNWMANAITIPRWYQVPLTWKLEVKKLLLEVLDTSYDSIFFMALKNGHNAFHVEGADLDPPELGGYELLPTWPNDQWNEELRYNEGEWVGIRIVNNMFAEREVNVSMWGWKYPTKCEYIPTGVLD